MTGRRDRAGRVASGVLTMTRRGDAFVRPDDGGTDVFVPAGRMATAMDGDRVAVRVDRRPTGRNPEGTVVEVLERSRTSVVGTFHRRKRLSFVVPLDRRLRREVMVPGGRDVEAAEGDVVVVRLTGFGTGRSRPTGSIERVLGPLGDPGIDVLAVAHGFDLSLDFPSAVLEAAKKTALTGTNDPGPHRVDRTGLLTFTIDPSDAKDHDDALSIEVLEGNRVEVGIHIADVSHFVSHGGTVDMEARARGTSVYLVDRTIPMLPPVLSSDVCSLMVDVPRLALSLFVELDEDGRILSRRYERTRIQCRHALSYEDAQAVLDGQRSIAPDLDAALRELDDHARRIRAGRHERGALDLDLPEAKVILNAEGDPVDIQRRDRLESHRLIEDYMILANEVVASDLAARDLGTLYRVHEPPSAEKTEELRDALAPLGLEVPRRRSLKPGDIQRVLEAPRGPEAHVLVSALVLRTLAKARYDTENLGHFGLASSGYTHFTSPIRRYPDLIVHRVLAAAFVGGVPPRDLDNEALAGIAALSSQREQAADEAERATVALKKVEFMERHLGDVFNGRVSGVAAFGVFVTLEEYFVDGLLHVRSLEDDYYRFSAKDYALIGERKGRRYRLGDPVRVQVARVDKEARHIDFVVLDGREPVRLTPPAARR
jgi:ribonuclease R